MRKRKLVIHEGVEYRRYNRLYSVSRDGKLLRQPTQGRRPLAAIGKTSSVVVDPRLRPDGYLEAGRQRLVHRMVAICWLENPTNAKLVHHINDDKTDNRAENLQWITPKEHNVHHLLGRRRPHMHTAETRQKLREYRLGKKQSKATKRKIGRAIRALGIKPPGRPIGTKMSEEECRRWGENHWRNTPCVVRGVRYRSFSEAGRAIGMNRHAVRHRCLSETSFPDFRVL